MCGKGGGEGCPLNPQGQGAVVDYTYRAILVFVPTCSAVSGTHLQELDNCKQTARMHRNCDVSVHMYLQQDW